MVATIKKVEYLITCNELRIYFTSSVWKKIMEVMEVAVEILEIAVILVLVPSWAVFVDLGKTWKVDLFEVLPAGLQLGPLFFHLY